MLLIIDGYNLIGKTHTIGGDLKKLRIELLEKLKEYSIHKVINVLVVFDGDECDQPYKTNPYKGKVKYMFSPVWEKADETIKKIVEKEKDNSIVVTDDNFLKLEVERNAGVVIPCDEFLHRMEISAREGFIAIDKEENEYEIWNGTTRKKGRAWKKSKKERKKENKLKKF